MEYEQAKIESLIFISGNEGITLDELSNLTSIPLNEVKTIVKILKVKYANDSNCSFKLFKTDNRVKLLTKEKFAPLVKKYFETPTIVSLSHAATETLAIIAYKQPITRLAIEEIRGVKSSAMIQRLLALDLIKEDGRLEEIGRPILYGTTTDFLDYVGISSLKELPPLPITNENDHQNEDLITLFEKTLNSKKEEK